jgi:hypothetical protein
MGDDELLHLAKDLEWLGCELEFYGHKHALEGFPQAGPTWSTFVEKQKGVLRTADKIERELKGAVRYNPQELVGVEYPLEETLDSIMTQLTAVEDIKQTAVFSVQDLPPKVRTFTKMVEHYLGDGSTTTR